MKRRDFLLSALGLAGLAVAAKIPAIAEPIETTYCGKERADYGAYSFRIRRIRHATGAKSIASPAASVI